MFRPNISGILYRRTGRNIHGKETYSAGANQPCAVVKLESLAQITTVRADSSASRGTAEDLVTDARILMPVTSPARIGDVLELYGVMIEITGFHPRVNTRGSLDHHELRGMVKKEL